MASTYGNLGIEYGRMGDCDRAVEYYKKAAAIFVAALGADHPFSAKSHHNVGDAYTQAGDFDAASPGRRGLQGIYFPDGTFVVNGVFGGFRMRLFIRIFPPLSATV